MSLSVEDVRAALKEGFVDALKDRFAKIATNELSATAAEGVREMESAMRNLKQAYEQAYAIAGTVFEKGTGTDG